MAWTLELLIGTPLKAWMNVSNFSFFGLSRLRRGLAGDRPPYKETQPMSHKEILKPGKILNPTTRHEAGGSVVSIVIMLWAGRSGIKPLSGKKYFSCPKRPHWLWFRNSLLRSRYRDSMQGAKRPGHEWTTLFHLVSELITNSATYILVLRYCPLVS